MLPESRSTPAPVNSLAPGVIPVTLTQAAGDGPPAGAAPENARGSAAADTETRRERSRRKAHRSRLHAYAALTVALVAFLIALAASNTAHVKVSWVFGSSSVSLVWLVLFAAILGWLLGQVATAAFHWRTRAPRRGRGGP